MARASIIIPTCNRPLLLRRAVASALSQDVPAIEVIIINDGDAGSVKPIEGTRVIETSGHRGPTRARQMGLHMLSSNSTAVCYLDDDDELLPCHVRLLSAALDEGAEFAFSTALYKYSGGVETTDPDPSDHNPAKRYYDPEALLSQNIAPVSSFMHTRAAGEQIGGWDVTLPRMEDWDFWARMFIAFGSPAKVGSVTNVIHKDNEEANRTTSNEFAYSMSCSWRDLVDDRLRHLSSEGRARLSPSDIKRFHVPKMAVVMPVPSGAKPAHLSASLEAWMNQDYEDVEIIVSAYANSPGSSAGLVDVLDEYVGHGVRLFGDLGEHQDPTGALDSGLLASRSEMVALSGHDGIPSADRLCLQAQFLHSHDEALVSSDYLGMSEDLGYCYWMSDSDSHPFWPTITMRRTVVEAIGGFEPHWGEEFVARARPLGMANIPRVLYRHRYLDSNSKEQKNHEHTF